MSNERNVTIAQACIARAMIKAMGMQAENQQRAACDQSPAYVESHFLNVIEEEGIGWNAIIGLLDQE
jgi:hypothetical protein